MRSKSVKVILDTNVLISFLIGKRLQVLKAHIVNSNITIVTTDRLMTEFVLITKRKKLTKYFPIEAVEDFISLLESISHHVQITEKYKICRDAKDNFLFDLIAASGADYLVTGDKDLIVHNPFLTASIVTPAEFEKLLNTHKI